MSVFPARQSSTAAALVADLAAPAEVFGNSARAIQSLASLADLRPGGLGFCNSGPDEIAARLARIGDATVIASSRCAAEAPALAQRMTLIAVPDPRRYFIRAFHLLVSPEVVRQTGIAATATIHPEAAIGPGASIGPGAFIDRGVTIGAGATIFGGVQIYEGTRIGRGVVVQANCSIGSHGQSFERDEDGSFLLMPHLSGVIIGDEVRIGANTTIVRGTLQDTVIGAQTMVGNNAVVGHNVTIGTACVIGAGVILCGSSRVGDRCWLSIAAVINSVAVGANAMVGAGAIVTRPVEDGMMVNGFPARVTARTNDYNQTSGR